jgi:hypothetical protein
MSTSGKQGKESYFKDDEELIRGWIRLCQWLYLWYTHVLVRLQKSLMNWIILYRKLKINFWRHLIVIRCVLDGWFPSGDFPNLVQKI